MMLHCARIINYYVQVCTFLHSYVDLSSFCVIFQRLSNIYREFQRGSRMILENRGSTWPFHPFKVGNWLRLCPYSFVSA